MYFHNFKEFLQEMLKVFKEKRFFYSVKYCLWVIWDKIQGVDFVKNEGYDRTGTNRERSTVYQATRDVSYLKKILYDFEITQDDAILDLGCGKGYMLKIFQEYPFGKVGGVELSKRLCDIANDNIRKKNLSKCTVYHMDAAEFEQYDEYTYIYMFNPFPQVVMEEVIKHIKLSLQRTERKLVVIYKVPACHNIIMNSGMFDLLKVIKGKTHTYNIYSSKV